MGIFDGYIIVSDMDGTLLNSKGKLSDENINAIKYFVNKFDTPFDFYYELGDYFDKKGYFNRNIGNSEYYRVFLDFNMEILKEDNFILKEINLLPIILVVKGFFSDTNLEPIATSTLFSSIFFTKSFKYLA